MTPCVLLLAGLAFPAGAAQPDPLPTPDFLLTAFADNQERIRSGIVRMEGTVLDRSAAGNPIEGPVRLFVAFDVDAKLVRFDRTEPVRPPPRADGRRDDANPSGHFRPTAVRASAADTRPPWLVLTRANVTLRSVPMTNVDGYAVSFRASHRSP